MSDRPEDAAPPPIHRLACFLLTPVRRRRHRPDAGARPSTTVMPPNPPMPSRAGTDVGVRQEPYAAGAAREEPGSAPYRTWPLDGLDEPVRTARRLTAETLERWRAGELSYEAAVVVSELVTNACRHGRPPVELSLFLEEAPDHRFLVIAVSDGDPAPPVPRDPCERGGFGLTVIAGYADIAVVPRRDGKTVTARLPWRP